MGLLLPSPERTMRIFISSTFRDMQAEREELVKRVFPRLRQLCEERGVAWGEVDLRWGITEEEAAEGRVLPICLAEIERCRPFFIGLLGERYGWVPDQHPADLQADEQFSWLAEHVQKSVTELEILHGALRPGPAHTHAYFYLRAADYWQQLPPGTNAADFVSENAQAAAQLALLKERLRQSGFPLREYQHPAEAGALIQADLANLIEELFPPLAYASAQASEDAAHFAWAAKLSETFRGRSAELARLSAHVAGAGAPLIVTGAAGVGKSALLAAWWRQDLGLLPPRDDAAEKSPGLLAKARAWLKAGRAEVPTENKADNKAENKADKAFVLAHFAGATADSTDPAALLRRLLLALKERLSLPFVMPEQPHQLPTAFASFLQAAATQGRVVLLLDGLEQVAAAAPELTLAWLPEELPTNVRLVVSAAPGVALEALRRRGWPALEVLALPSTVRAQIISGYLGRYRKKLNQDLSGQIAAAAQTAHPLYLRTLLEELRVFGQHELLAQHVRECLSADSATALYAQALERYEQDYEQRRSGLVGDALGWLWAARQGLSESEWLDLLGTNGAPLPYAVWAPLFFALREPLANRAGVWTFFHPALRAAVEQRYLRESATRDATRRALAAYFAARPLSPRQVEELPWQWAQLGDWPRLAALLADPRFLSAAWPARQFEVRHYWAQIEAHSTLRLAASYQPVVATPAQFPDALWAVCSLLGAAGQTEQALSVSEHLENQFRAAGDIVGLQSVLSLRGAWLNRSGRWRAALDVFAAQAELARQLNQPAVWAAALGNQAVIWREQGELARARQMHHEEERLYRQLQDEAGLSVSWGNQAILLQTENDLAGARQLLHEQAQLCRRLGDLTGLQKNLGNQAALLAREEKWQAALELHEQEEQLCRRLREPAALQVCLGNQARLYELLGDFDRALELMEQREQLCRHESFDPAGLVMALAQQARLFAERLRQPRHALPLAEEAAALAARYDLLRLRRQTAELEQAIREQVRP